MQAQFNPDKCTIGYQRDYCYKQNKYDCHNIYGS